MMQGLIFFVFIGFFACQKTAETTGITVRWNNNRATGIAIPQNRLASFSLDSISQLLSVRLAKTGAQPAILGEYQLADNAVIFEPLIPFTRGLRYEVWLRNQRLDGFEIPLADPKDAPELLAVYPSQDSLPDNLLKIYLRFSRPMREGQSPKYVALLKNRTDTVPGVFLDLQPELWNPDRTMLTLWLDPGRIKRDLQPNKRLGAPLQKSLQYQLVVSALWPDQQGAKLAKAFTKAFVTIPRDSLSPNPNRWQIKPPAADGNQPLDITFGEPLDYSLLTETLHVIGNDGKPITGKWHIGDEEKTARFKPAQNWKPGRYTLRIEARLEDLAGNNLNRPFDRDLTQKTVSVASASFFERSFRISRPPSGSDAALIQGTP
ncbi:Ig-like domain-containing protein [Larkinella rosea]|uniref:SbsA Ig-like domain-containing protein n=1 Tax=Larkinella rosea TaxID=2025312 RepID=A0A3P1BBG4_9BACT|nr:Ig-like domain-containing protein [Larkinella rosea]RRA97973.1 hypothetical protein EHT25_30335 [Larkinella rosea]